MTKEEILAAVIARTGRTNITSIDTELDSVLKDITGRFSFLEDSKSISLVSGTYEYSVVTDLAITGLRDILDIRNSNGYQVDRLKTLQEFLDYRAGTASSGEPRYYFLMNRTKLLLYPTPDDAYIFKVYYSYIHPAQATILLGDDFKQCVIEGVCYEVYKSKGIPDKGAHHKTSYEAELNKLIWTFPSEKVMVKYRDV